MGELTPDRQLLIVECIRALRELLERTDGHPPDEHQISSKGQPTYLWHDRNWEIAYTVQRRKRIGRDADVVVCVRGVTLRNP